MSSNLRTSFYLSLLYVKVGVVQGWYKVTKSIKRQVNTGKNEVKMNNFKTLENKGLTPRQYRLEIFSDYV